MTSKPRNTTKKRNITLAVAIAAVALVALFDPPWIGSPARAVFFSALAMGAVVLAWRLSRAFLYKVGRRLAFSYFLLGVLPIPMAGLLLGITAFLLAGSFIGHVYLDEVHSLTDRLEIQARLHLEDPQRPVASALGDPPAALALYRGGRRVSGDPRAPDTWPQWPIDSGHPPVLLLDDGRPSLAARAGDGNPGALAVTTGNLQQALSEATGILVRFDLSDETEDPAMELTIGGRETVLKTLRPDGGTNEDVERFFDRLAGDSSDATESRRGLDQALIRWGLLGGPRLRLADGSPLAEHTPVTLITTPRQLYQHLFAASAELDAYAWLSLLILATLLFWIYFAAALMAILLIYGLSSAVNRLSEATTKVQEGDFGARIPVKRRDQVDDLQRSFNDMAANLERSVRAAAQKEALEKELAIARELQQSLVPHNLPTGGGIEFAAFFEPSAAIGGDYFDILRLAEHRLAVVVADVSGHGLHTGLRMAMLKAALSVLIEKVEQPEEILERLDTLVRSEDDRRFFVTATLALFDYESGELQLFNAGHPPTYVLRGGEAEEILLPGSPLGGLGGHFGQDRRDLEPRDLVVWLSDGLIEATDADDQPFGYARVQETLRRASANGEATAEEVKIRLLEAVREHAADRPAEDDLTLVVMRWNPARDP